jgi:hypothetical protein
VFWDRNDDQSVIIIGSRFCAWRDVGESSSPKRAQRIKTGSSPLVQRDVRMWHISDLMLALADVCSSRVKRTSLKNAPRTAFDPQRKSAANFAVMQNTSLNTATW